MLQHVQQEIRNAISAHESEIKTLQRALDILTDHRGGQSNVDGSARRSSAVYAIESAPPAERRSRKRRWNPAQRAAQSQAMRQWWASKRGAAAA